MNYARFSCFFGVNLEDRHIPICWLLPVYVLVSVIMFSCENKMRLYVLVANSIHHGSCLPAVKGLLRGLDS